MDAKETPRDVIGEVINERKRQDEKWGVQDHEPWVWLAILMEEVGEASKGALEAHYAPEEGGGGFKEVEKSLAEYRAELIQVAAVAIAAVECLDREGA